MAQFAIAISGWGLLPALLALSLSQRNADQNLLLLCADQTIGGEEMEPVVASQLDQAARALVDPFCVKRWPGYFIARDGAIEQFDDEVWLIDPVQVWLELLEREAQCTAVAACGPVSEADGQLSWAGGSAAIDRYIDLFVLTELRSESEIMGIEAVRQLGLLILADYDTAGPAWEANQLLPLGDERVLVRKLPKRTGLVAANSSFASILNALVSD